MPIPGRKYIVVQYEKDRVVEQPDETKLKSTVKQSEKDRVVTQSEKDRVVEQPDETKLKSTVIQAEKDRLVTQTEKDRVIEQPDPTKLKMTMHGSHEGDSISFEQDDIDATTGYVLIDLSDTTNYPHSNTTSIGIDWIIITGLADTSAVGYYDIGFITRINGTNSDWQSIFHAHFDKKEERFEAMLNFIPDSAECDPTKHLSGGGMKFVDDTTFNTGGTVKGTYSDTTPPAVGDIVLKVTRTAGKANLAVAISYHSH